MYFRTIENQGAAVDHVAEQTARRAAIAQLEDTRADRRVAGVGITAGQDQCAIARLVQRTG
ncbi:hypothetical protein D3C81_1945570 [compost metagenome]